MRGSLDFVPPSGFCEEGLKNVDLDSVENNEVKTATDGWLRAYTAIEITPNTSMMANQNILDCVDLTMENPRFSRVWKLKGRI